MTRRTVFIVGGAVISVALLGTGVGMTLAANTESDERQRLITEHGIEQKKCPISPGCADMKAAVARQDTFENVARGAFVVGGAAALGTAVYAIWPTLRPERKTGLRAQPMATASSGGLWISGAF